MKPDAYMPFYGNDFFAAVRLHPSYVCAAYLRAIWHYWHVSHCRPMTNDDQSLRRICEVFSDDEWGLVRSVVFDNDKFFTLDADGNWYQKRADEEWEKAITKYNKQCERTKAATAQRLYNMNARRNDSRNVGRNDSR